MHHTAATAFQVVVSKPSKIILQALSRPYVLRSAALVSVLLVASCSGLGFFIQRIVVQTLRRLMLRVIWGKDMQVRSTNGEAAAIAIASAVKAASSAAAQAACLSHLMLTMRAEEKHQNRIVVSALQAVSAKIMKAQLIMESTVGETDRTRKQSPTNCMPWDCDGHSNDRSDKFQNNSFEHIQTAWKGPLNSNWVSDIGGKLSDKSQSDVKTSSHRAASFMEVMAMLERGETPPGIREINDKPPIPNQLPSISCLQPKPKPWEMAR